jgi:hypothetical protein
MFITGETICRIATNECCGTYNRTLVGDNIYVIRWQAGRDVNQELGLDYEFSDDLELAVPDRIAPNDIRAVTLPEKKFSILNPNWTP